MIVNNLQKKVFICSILKTKYHQLLTHFDPLTLRVKISTIPPLRFMVYYLEIHMQAKKIIIPKHIVYPFWAWPLGTGA